MPSFEERLALARQLAAASHKEKKSKRRNGRERIQPSPAQIEEVRVEAIKNSEEWQQMISFSQSRDFLLALKMYWEKFADKEVNPFVLEKSLYKNQAFLNVVSLGLLGEKGGFTPATTRPKTFEEALTIGLDPAKQFFPDHNLIERGLITHSFVVGKTYYQGKSENDLSGWESVVQDFNIFWQEEDRTVDQTSYSSDGPGFWNLKSTTDGGYSIPKGLVIAINSSNPSSIAGNDTFYPHPYSYFTPEQFWEYMAELVS